MADSLLNPPLSEEASVEFWMRKWELAQAERFNFDSHWSCVAERIWPEADQFRSERTPGQKRRQLVYSSHGSRTLSKWTSVMLSTMVPKTEKYQQLKASNEDLNKDPSVKLFFEQLTRILFQWRNAPQADFYGTMHPTFMSLGAFGNGCFFMDETQRGVRYIPVDLSRVWIGVDHYKRPTTIFYKAPLSAYAAHQKWQHLWGNNPPDRIKQNLETSPWKDMQFLHVVTPRKAVDPYALGPKRMPWMSLYIALEDRQILDEGGYEEMPYIFGRESVLANEHYGRGPAMMILPELGTVNAMKKTHLTTGQRVAAPPLLTADDALFQGARRINLAPDAVNRGLVNNDGRPLLLPLQSGARLDLTREMMQDEEAAIDDAFGLNLFRILLEDPRSSVTATEILQRAQEKGDLIAPGVTSRQAEIMSPETARLLGVIARKNAMPPMPPALIEAEGEYEIEYTSPANRLQRAGELVAVNRTIEMVAPLAQLDPTVLMKFKAEDLIELGMEVQGGPTSVLRSKDEFAQLLQAHQQAQQQAQMAEQVPGMASAAKDGATALKVIQGGAA
jgi:Bacteriophage head to tail connecting protein